MWAVSTAFRALFNISVAAARMRSACGIMVEKPTPAISFCISITKRAVFGIVNRARFSYTEKEMWKEFGEEEI